MVRSFPKPLFPELPRAPCVNAVILDHIGYCRRCCSSVQKHFKGGRNYFCPQFWVSVLSFCKPDIPAECLSVWVVWRLSPPCFLLWPQLFAHSLYSFRRAALHCGFPCVSQELCNIRWLYPIACSWRFFPECFREFERNDENWMASHSPYLYEVFIPRCLWEPMRGRCPHTVHIYKVSAVCEITGELLPIFLKLAQPIFRAYYHIFKTSWKQIHAFHFPSIPQWDFLHVKEQIVDNTNSPCLYGFSLHPWRSWFVPWV